MIKCEVADITHPGTEAIVSAANGCGIMGAGVAGAIREAAGPDIETEARGIIKKRGRPFDEGSCYSTGSGLLRQRGVIKIYHAVTMKYPGGPSSLHFINLCIEESLEMSIKDNMESIAIPALGTGIGRLEINAVASIILQKSKRYDHLLDIFILDKNRLFIETINKIKS